MKKTAERRVRRRVRELAMWRTLEWLWVVKADWRALAVLAHQTLGRHQ